MICRKVATVNETTAAVITATHTGPTLAKCAPFKSWFSRDESGRNSANSVAEDSDLKGMIVRFARPDEVCYAFRYV